MLPDVNLSGMNHRLRLLVSSLLLGFGLFGVGSIHAEEPVSAEGSVVALTMNIRYDNPGDGVNAWPSRKKAVARYLKEADADFIGLQEATPPQLVEVAEALDEYAFIARTRKKSGIGGEATPLFWRVDRWTIDPSLQGTRWLSETPEVPGSRSWDSSLPRIVTWARFIEKGTGRGVWVYNTHFDHRGAEARLESGKLVAGFIGSRKHADEPVIVMGDFNCLPESDPIKAMKVGAGPHPVKLVDAWAEVNPQEPDNATWNGWKVALQGRRIDLVLVSQGVHVKQSTIDRTLVEGRPVSDHWPVRVTFELSGGVGNGIEGGSSPDS